MDKRNNEIDLFEFISKLDWRKLLKWGLIGMAFGVVVAFSMPREYVTMVEFAPESKSREQDQLSQMGALGALAGLNGMNGINNNPGSDGVSMRIYPRILRSTPYLLEFFDTQVGTVEGRTIPLNQYLREDIRRPWWSYVMAVPGYVLGALRGKSDKEELSADKYTLTPDQRKFISALRKRAKIELDEETWTVKISARMQDPEVAAVVADSMVVTLQRYMSDYWQMRARASLENTQRAFDEAYQEYRRAQGEYADAVDNNQNLSLQKARIRVELLQNEYQVAYTVYQQMASQLSLAKFKLQENTMIATVIEPSIKSPTPASPRRKLLAAAFFILGVLGYVGVLFVKAEAAPAIRRAGKPAGEEE